MIYQFVTREDLDEAKVSWETYEDPKSLIHVAEILFKERDVYREVAAGYASLVSTDNSADYNQIDENARRILGEK